VPQPGNKWNLDDGVLISMYLTLATDLYIHTLVYAGRYRGLLVGGPSGAKINIVQNKSPFYAAT
jgi:hypothetical protein